MKYTHWWQKYQEVNKGICKPKYAELCQEEYELTLKWVKKNPDKAANFILNVITEQIENEIEIESNYMPIWFEIKGIEKEKRPIQSLTTEEAPIALDNLTNKKELKEFIYGEKNK